MISSLNDFKNVFFIGIAGTGMSAIAQYLAGTGKDVSGSDRDFRDGEDHEVKAKLEAEGISCFMQNGAGITEATELVIVSTAIESTVGEVIKAQSLNIPIIKRSELLSYIAKSRKTIAVAGTSGKSTTCAMLYDILSYSGLNPGIISGAGLVSIISQGKLGNAMPGDPEGWLIIEADESDGSIVEYEPEIGVLLNIDKDHQEIDELIKLFTVFKHNTKSIFIVNRDNLYTKVLSADQKHDFSCNSGNHSGFTGSAFLQEGWNISFKINETDFSIKTIGHHNMENAVAAVATAFQLGISLDTSSDALSNYEGIYRRHQLLGVKNSVYVIDDYAHNPVKCASSIAACQGISEKVVAWFQPHGYGPTKFLKDDFIREISAVLRDTDEIWMSEIYYAGGTADKSISSADLVNGICLNGKSAYFISDRNELLKMIKPRLNPGNVLLLMGARDPGLESFAKNVFSKL